MSKLNIYTEAQKFKIEPMKLGEYYKHKGWNAKIDEVFEKEGFLKTDIEGKEKWIERPIIMKNYRSSGGLDFGIALLCLKDGKRLYRDGWNDRLSDEFVYMVPGKKLSPDNKLDPALEGLIEHGFEVPYSSHIAIKTAQNNVIPWTPSQDDILAKDWVVIGE